LDSPYLHLGSPGPRDYSFLKSWIQGAWDDVLVLFPDWKLRSFNYDQQFRFVASDQISAVLGLPGPILLIKPVKKKDLTTLTARIKNRFPMQTIDVVCKNQLTEEIKKFLTQFENGEPLLPRNYVIGILIVNKLVKYNMWGGKNKGYLWSHDIANGRGVPNEFKDTAP